MVAANRDEFYKRPTEKLHSWGGNHGSSQVEIWIKAEHGLG